MGSKINRGNLIHVFGTSHVSKESLELVEDKIESIEPEIIALELDQIRLNSLLNDNEGREGGPLFIRVIKYFQDSAGKKTGVMPGEEMLHAFRIAERNNIDVALIDQDIRITLSNIQGIPISEKIKAGVQLLMAFIAPKFENSIHEIPNEDLIQEMLFEMKFKFPNLFKVLVEDRNQHMIDEMRSLDEKTSGDIVAFVGAAHKNKLEDKLKAK